MKKIMLLVLAVFFIAIGAQAQSKNTEKVVIKTSAVCNMCKNTIEKDLAFEKGVKEATLDVKSQMLTVTYLPKKTNPDKIRTAVTKIGYDADSIPAVSKAYEKLDDCCKKDKGVHLD